LILSKSNYGKSIIKKGVFGVVIIISVAAVIIATGGTLAINKSKEIAFLWTGSGLLMALSIALGWGMLR
jgi:succinate dehydrogenase/fumarate reductase flavoprotein subunit